MTKSATLRIQRDEAIRLFRALERHRKAIEPGESFDGEAHASVALELRATLELEAKLGEYCARNGWL